MSTNDKKDKNEELFDHIIEYGAGRWTDEISPDNIPEEELSDQLNQKIDTIFSSARKRANRKRRFITARRIAAVFVVLFTMASVTVMSVEAFRVPVLNFIFKTTKQNKVLVKFQNEEKILNQFSNTFLLVIISNKSVLLKMVTFVFINIKIMRKILCIFK